ncbi:hypothetical protein [Methanococcus maripaludis]|uniref:Uncharacterized protein n=1 Tax=Methanococcus maripaludis TaxID=39152 RepID=A0A7J9PCH9_METMI|nr:hypothetical protein [Methanococcus maripaludis]MBA2852994.1 hypothetical protein [Methanococcus maripaludis]MBA2860955.1 hypothetical protein [Methanococcus maripaludis]
MIGSKYKGLEIRPTKQWEEIFGDLPEYIQKNIFDKCEDIILDDLNPFNCFCGTGIPLVEMELNGEISGDNVKLSFEVEDEDFKQMVHDSEIYEE